MSDQFISLLRSALITEAEDESVEEMKARVAEIDVSIEDMKRYRDSCARGSARRSDFAASIRRLKDWRKKLVRKIERSEQARLNEGTLNEGGLGGHLMHLYDNWDLTFGELKDILRAASQGELEEVSEKADGQNLFITWDVSEGKLKAARNKGNIKSGGLDAGGLASKFAGRGSVYDAFVNGFSVIQKAVGSLSPQEKVKIFGPNGNVWYSVEIMFVDNPNTIVYDKNNVVFHKPGSAVFDEDGNATDEDISERFDALVSRVDQLQNALADKTWNIMGPPLQQLKKMESDEHLHKAITRIDNAVSPYGIVDGDSLGLYIKTCIYIDVMDDVDIPHKKREQIVRRAMGEKGAPTVTQIAKGMEKDEKAKVKEIVAAAREHMRKCVIPIEMAIHDFAVEVLRGMESVFIMDDSKEVGRLRDEVHTAIEAIEASGNEDAMAILKAQMQKLKSVENIATAAEGIVFHYKGNSYKFTGAFAPANQLLGLFKYGRGKIPPLKIVQKRESDNDDLGEAFKRYLTLNEKWSTPIRGSDDVYDRLVALGYEVQSDGKNTYKVITDDRSTAYDTIEKTLTDFDHNPLQGGSMGRFERQAPTGRGKQYILIKPASRRAADIGSDYENTIADRMSGKFDSLGVEVSTAGFGHGSDIQIKGPKGEINIETKTSMGADFGQFSLEYLPDANVWRPVESRGYEKFRGIFDIIFTHIDDRLSKFTIPDELLPKMSYKGGVIKGVKLAHDAKETVQRLNNEWFGGQVSEFIEFPFELLADYYSMKGDDFLQVKGKGLYAVADNSVTRAVEAPRFSEQGLRGLARIRLKSRGGTKGPYGFNVAIKFRGTLRKSSVDIDNQDDWDALINAVI